MYDLNTYWGRFQHYFWQNFPSNLIHDEFHPDTGNKINTFGRMSFQVKINKESVFYPSYSQLETCFSLVA